MLLENITQEYATAMVGDSMKQEEEVTKVEREKEIKEPEITLHALTG